MGLREKTHEKFKSFFEKMSKMYVGQEFELAYSEIQRETGAASITLKRALQSLEADGWLEVKPGRNTRYARFRVVSSTEAEPPAQVEDTLPEQPKKEEKEIEKNPSAQWEVDDLYHQVESLRRRIRTQEMTIALLQERLAEVEDKLHKR